MAGSGCKGEALKRMAMGRLSQGRTFFTLPVHLGVCGRSGLPLRAHGVVGVAGVSTSCWAVRCLLISLLVELPGFVYA